MTLDIFRLPKSRERVIGERAPRSYEPAVRFEGSLGPDIELIRAGIAFESSVPIRRIKAGESVDTSAGDLLLVESDRTSASGRHIGSSVVIDDGLGNRLVVSGEVNEEATDTATSETAVENAPLVVESSSTTTVSPATNPAPAPDEVESTQSEGPSSNEVIAAKFATAAAAKTVTSGGTSTTVAFPAPAPGTYLTSIEYAAEEDATSGGGSAPSSSTNYLNTVEYAEFEDAFG